MKEDYTQETSSTDEKPEIDTPTAAIMRDDDQHLALCLRVVRFNSAVMAWKDHQYNDVPSYGIELNKVGEALYELDLALKPARKTVPEVSSLASGIQVLLDEIVYALDQHDYGAVTEESIVELKNDCDRLISVVFDEVLRISRLDLNPWWVSFVTSRLDEEQLMARDRIFLREASRRGISVLAKGVLSGENCV